MNYLKKMSFITAFITLFIVYSCQKENVEPQKSTEEIENFEKASQRGPQINASITPFCSGKPVGVSICNLGVGPETTYNWLKVGIDNQTSGFYSTLNYKIYKASNNSLVFNCDKATNSNSYNITAVNGLLDNTTYKVVITATGGQSMTYYTTTNSCGTAVDF